MSPADSPLSLFDFNLPKNSETSSNESETTFQNLRCTNLCREYFKIVKFSYIIKVYIMKYTLMKIKNLSH